MRVHTVGTVITDGDPAMQTQITPSARTLSTEQAAAALHIKPQTLRAAHCRDGHYFGVRPVKLSSRMLAWPTDDIERLLNGEEAES